MHNLHRFNNTPCALILSQLQSGCCLVGLHVYMCMDLTEGAWMWEWIWDVCGSGSWQWRWCWWGWEVGVVSWKVQTAGVSTHAASLSPCLPHTLIPFTDQIKAQMTNAQRLVTSVLEHTVHPSPCWALLVTTQSQSPCRQHLQQWTSAH